MVYDERDPKLIEGYPIYIPANSSLMKPFTEKTKEEAQQYFEWFMILKPIRLDEMLESIAKLSPGLLDKLDHSPESLTGLFSWFLTYAKVIRRSRADIREQKKQLPDFLKNQPGNVSTHMLDSESMSVLNTIGIYMGDCFVKHDPRLNWGIAPRNKSSGSKEPAVIGFKKDLFFSPFQIMKTIAEVVSSGEATHDRLFNVFNFTLSSCL